MEKYWEVAGVEQGLVTEEGGEEAPTTGMDCAIGSNDFMEIFYFRDFWNGIGKGQWSTFGTRFRIELKRTL